MSTSSHASFYQTVEPDQLPLPNKQVMYLVQYVTQEDVDINTLAEMISANPALTSKVLKLVNSPLFRLQHDVKTIKEASVVLGLTHLSSLILCFAVQGALTTSDIKGLDVDVFWEDSFRRGIAARLLSEKLAKPIEEAFTAGILQDMGLLVLFMLEPGKADRWPLLRANAPERRLLMEEELFGTNHAAVGALIAKKWQLPQAYIESIERHHDETASDLGKLMSLSDHCNAFFTCRDKNRVFETLKQQAFDYFSLDRSSIEWVLEAIPEALADTATSININIGEQLQFENILDDAKSKLIEDNLSFLELTWKLQGTLQERDIYAEKLNDELNVAREIQQSLQSDTSNIECVAALNIPAMTLSGDFYDYFELPDGRICFCLGDVSGKGTHAAIMMAKAISLFRCLCKVEESAERIIELMNIELCETTTRGMFVTFAAGWLNPNNNQLSIINAGHLPLLIVGEKSAQQLLAQGPPLGVSPDLKFPAENVLFDCQRLYLYSDGFIECKTSSGEELGIKGFLSWVVQSKHLNLEDQLSWIEQQFQNQAEAQLDDLTLMIIAAKTGALD